MTTATANATVTTGISHEEYAKIKAINQSALKKADLSLAHVHHAITGEHEPASDVLRLGTAAHALCLEGDRFGEICVVMPKVDRRTKEGKAAYAEFEASRGSRTLIDQSEYEQAKAIADSIHRHPKAGVLMRAAGETEVCIVWTDEPTGMRCKMRMDKIVPGGITPDIKTTQCAKPRAFAASVVKYGYAEQQAFYEMGYEAAYGVRPEFCLIPVESKPPHAVAVYRLSDATMEVARKRVRRWLDDVGTANRTGVWPGYSERVEELEAPEWYLRSGDHLPAIEESDDHDF